MPVAMPVARPLALVALGALAVAPSSGAAQSAAGARAAANAATPVALAPAVAADTLRRRAPDYQVGDRAFVGMLMGTVAGPVMGVYSACGMFRHQADGLCGYVGGALGMWAGWWAGGTLGAVTGIRARGCGQHDEVALRAVGRSALFAAGGILAGAALIKTTSPDAGMREAVVTSSVLLGGPAAIAGVVSATRAVNRCEAR
ncbi:MAG TPA: hypothetical protein VKA84_16460 [Gemmatimonadaceae bacterium]|nr:hypothetical protein [Gemmatimonadaceae bacterium]